MKMSVLTRILDKSIIKHLPKTTNFYSSQVQRKQDEFLPLNLKGSKGQTATKKKLKKHSVLPPRNEQMAIDQDWGTVWPGPRSFHPGTVPLPIRQGYVKKGVAPGKYGNAELMKIPNFLHLTPPVVKRQCEALKKFCTPWPENLATDEECEKHFPIEVTSSNYCFSSPSIRNPLARIVTLKIKLSSLKLNDHAKDKFRRLIGERYDEKTDTVTIVTDRCPLQKQNYDYAMYLLTALFHESWIVEPWEELKTEADMEFYDWEKNASKKTIEDMFAKATDEIENAREYAKCISDLMNEGESEYTVTNYGLAVRKLLSLPEQNPKS